MFAVKSGFSDIIGIFVVSDLFPILLFPGPENDPRNLLPASTFLDEIRFFRVGIAAPVEMTLKQKVIQV